MWKISFLFLTLFIAGCSTTKIHVYTAGVDQTTQQQLFKSLNSAGFNTYRQQIPPPQLKTGAYIIYTPSSRSTQTNQQLEQILSSLNLPKPEPLLFSMGEGISAHKYTKENIGLYVIAGTVPKDDELKTLEETSSVVDWELGSVNCSKSYVLDFMENGKSYISLQEDGKDISSANWKIENRQLVLTKLFKRYVYLVSEENKTITPVTDYPEPFGCQYRSNFDIFVQLEK